MAEGQVIVGLEVHCQLDTRSKLFCGCSTDYRNDGPNTHVCPICLGLPGTMPALNRRAIEYAMKVAKALNCEIIHEAEFSRKNYFYPDLDKAYQITQYDKPLAQGGYLEIESDGGGEKKVRLTRIHVEEDPGRLVHMGNAERGRYSLVDYNRAGIPLIEIVSEPDMRSPKEARKFLNKLRATLEYLSVFDSEKEGSLRVDANISIRGSERVEVKNITSYKGVEKALTFEVTRQKNLLRRGQKVDRETRHYLEARGVTQSARSKEQEHDYRYFPEPDLRPLRVRSWVDNIILPELPDARRERFMKEYGISLNHARTLTGDFKLANFFEKWAKEYRKNKELKSPVLDINKQEVLRIPPKGTLLISVPSTWVADTLIGELNYREMGFDEILSGDFYEKFAKLTILLDDNHITSNSAIEVLRVMLNQLKNKEFVESPNDIVNRLGLTKSAGDDEALAAAIEEAIDENPKALADYRNGESKAVNFLVGQVMKKTRGKADPATLNRMMAEALKKRGQ